MSLRTEIQFSHHVSSGTQNTAADSLSRIDLNPKERVELKSETTLQPNQYK